MMVRKSLDVLILQVNEERRAKMQPSKCFHHYVRAFIVVFVTNEASFNDDSIMCMCRSRGHQLLYGQAPHDLIPLQICTGCETRCKKSWLEPWRHGAGLQQVYSCMCEWVLHGFYPFLFAISYVFNNFFFITY